MARKISCTRCSSIANPNGEPIEQRANYVRGDDMVETDTVVRTVAIVEGYAEDIRHDIEARQINPDSERSETYGEQYSTEELQRMMHRNDSRLPFAIHSNLFRRTVIGSPEDIKGVPGAVRAESKTMQIEQQKTGIVCSDCTKDEDTVIWGDE